MKMTKVKPLLLCMTIPSAVALVSTITSCSKLYIYEYVKPVETIKVESIEITCDKQIENGKDTTLSKYLLLNISTIHIFCSLSI